ncbi:MNNG and nitrosoguanidine resistance protein [Paraphaeosphaeria sporulosa]
MLRRLKQRVVGSKNASNTASHGQTNREEPARDAEQGKPHSEPPTPVGFWDSSLKHVRNRAFGKWIITTVFLMAFILAVLSIYWGVFFQVQHRLNHLIVYVVDFDGLSPYNTNPPLVGPTITQMTQQMLTSGEPTLGFSVRSPSEFNNDPIQVRQAIYNFDAWAAIIINPNATSLLYSAISTGNTSYDPLGACQLVYQDSRDDTNWYDFILPIISAYMTQAQSMVGTQWAQTALQNASDTETLRNIQAVPQAINPAIGFSEFNLRPFYPYTGIPAVSIGLIYLIIISFFSFSFYLPIHMQYLNPKGHPPLKFYQLIIWRWCATISAYVFLSLAYSFVSIAFQINFTRANPVQSETQVTDIAYGNPPAYGNGTFPVYWMLNFFGMIALGLACENVAMIVGAPWMGCWLIFWVITNVSTAFYDIEIAPSFYRWGYAWPLHSVVEGSRQILFNLHPRIGLDFGILIAWGAANTAFFPVCCWFQRWKSKKHVTEYWVAD